MELVLLAAYTALVGLLYRQHRHGDAVTGNTADWLDHHCRRCRKGTHF